MLYTKTDAGKDAIKDRSHVLSPKQRSGLILINGVRPIEDILKMVSGIGFSMADVSQLEQLVLIVSLSGSASSSARPWAGSASTGLAWPAPVGWRRRCAH